METPRAGTFLPASEDTVLGEILHYLEGHPEDNRSVAELALEAKITERTLSRRCRQDQSMLLTEWWNRMRVVNVIAMIEEGKNVGAIVLEFGYSSASVFIAMFK